MEFSPSINEIDETLDFVSIPYSTGDGLKYTVPPEAHSKKSSIVMTGKWSRVKTNSTLQETVNSMHASYKILRFSIDLH